MISTEALTVGKIVIPLEVPEPTSVLLELKRLMVSVRLVPEGIPVMSPESVLCA